MNIEFQYKIDDFIKFNKTYLLNEYKKKWGFFVIVTLLGGYFSMNSSFDWGNFAIGSCITFFILLIIFIVAPFIISHQRIKKLVLTDKALFEKKIISITAEGINSESISRSSNYIWESIQMVNHFNDFITLTLSDEKQLIIPKRAFSLESDFTKFYSILQNKIQNDSIKKPNSFIGNKTSERGSITISQPMKTQSIKPSYWVGILCIVPVVGVIVGFIMLYQGIFKYKDKWFSIIGSLGIILTIVFFSIIMPVIDKAIDFNTGFEDISQEKLNVLVKEIEFYKIQNGVYPDNLECLSSDNLWFSIYDPLQTRQDNSAPIKFNYQKVNDRYYLFSSGKDGIPNTEDDILPAILKNGESKIGLIR